MSIYNQVASMELSIPMELYAKGKGSFYESLLVVVDEKEIHLESNFIGSSFTLGKFPRSQKDAWSKANFALFRTRKRKKETKSAKNREGLSKLEIKLVSKRGVASFHLGLLKGMVEKIKESACRQKN